MRSLGGEDVYVTQEGEEQITEALSETSSLEGSIMEECDMLTDHINDGVTAQLASAG